MSTEVSAAVADQIMHLLKDVEGKTDLTNLSVINRTGMRLATSKSAEMDANATTASSSALIDLGEKMITSVDHGNLREILLRNELGYGILMAISEDLMIFGTLAKAYKIGYYLGYIRNLAVKLAQLVLGELTEETLEFFKRKEIPDKDEIKPGDVEILKPSAQDDMAAMQDVMNFLSDWGDEEDLAPEPVMAGSSSIGLPEEGTEEESIDDMFAAMDAISASSPTSVPPPAPAVDSDMDAALAALDEEKTAAPEPETQQLDELDHFTIPDVETSEVASHAEDLGIPLYEGEVPPIPLSDVATTMDFGTDTGEETYEEPQAEWAGNQEYVASPETQLETESFTPSPAPGPVEETPTIPPPPLAAPPTDPSFEFVDEYNDVDLDIDEADAMTEALSELGWIEDEDEEEDEE